MHRRAYLAGVAGSLTGLGGCLSTVPLLGEPIADVEVVDTTAEGIDFDVTLPRSRVTTARTVTLRVKWTNTSEKPVTVAEDRRGANEPIASTDGNLYLIPSDYDVLRADDSCWKPDSQLGADGDQEATDLAPGESFRNPYQLWSNAHTDSCFPTGTYRVGRDADRLVDWSATFEVTNLSE